MKFSPALEEKPMKKRKNTIVSLVAAALAVCGLSAMAELVPSTRLPLPTEGLVFHGDAGETSSITTDAAGHVLDRKSVV